MTVWKRDKLTRRDFIKRTAGGIGASFLGGIPLLGNDQSNLVNDLFWVKGIPDDPFYSQDQPHYHAGLDSLLSLMGNKGLKFYRSNQQTALSGPSGIIAPEDVVLIKVNAQWKYRGCTNSDLVRGLIQRILDHPDVFTGEVVIFENGQGRGSLDCDTAGGSSNPYPDRKVHANANDERHSFLYLANEIFQDPRVTSYLLDSIRSTFIGDNDHSTEGYRIYENVSYPCFTTAGGNRIELREGIWTGSGYSQNLKLINVPVLKHHDRGGSEITAALKHVYGILSMKDGQSRYRHYSGLGNTCGKMFVSVRTPELNILDAIWVSHASLKGYPEETTHRSNQILASQDPVALDYWAAKYILYPIDSNDRHHPDFPGIDIWLKDAEKRINSRGGLTDPNGIILVNQVTKNEARMQVHERKTESFAISGRIADSESKDSVGGVILRGLPGNPVTDSSGHYSGRVYLGWKGTVRPEKNGYVFMPSSRTYDGVNSDLLSQDYSGQKTLVAPLNFSGRKVMNRSLVMSEYINILTWNPNPNNTNIAAYRLYDNSDERSVLLAEFASDVFEHWIRGVDRDREYVYALTAVNSAGREGSPAIIAIK
jgi:hypothetical protein